MRIRILFFLFITNVFACFAQIQFENGQFIECDEPWGISCPISTKENFIIVRITQKKGVVIERYNNQTLQKESVYYYVDLPEEYRYNGIYYIGSVYYLFYSNYDRKVKSNILYCCEIDVEMGRVVGSPKVIADPSKFISKDFNKSMYEKLSQVNDGNLTEYLIFVSKDRSKFAVRFRVRPETKLDKLKRENVYYLSFESDGLYKIWEREYTLPYIYNNTGSQVFYCMNNGDIVYFAKGKGEDTNNSWIRKIYRISEDNERSIVTSNNRDYSLFHAENNEFYNFRLHSVRQGNKYNELFFSKLDENGKSYFDKTIRIPLETFQMFYSPTMKAKIKSKYENEALKVDNLNIDYVYFMSDSTILILLESKLTNNIYRHFYLLKIDNQGNLLWSKKLAKNQEWHYPFNNQLISGDSRYKFIVENEKVYLLFIDKRSNAAITENSRPHKYKFSGGEMYGERGAIYAYVIDHQTGNWSREFIRESTDVGEINTTYILPGNFLRIPYTSSYIQEITKSLTGEKALIKMTFNK